MWNALRSDLKEFVSTVTEDTSQVLSKIDDSFPVLNSAGGADRDGFGGEMPSPEEHEAQRRMRLDETYTSPLVIIDDDGVGEDPNAFLAQQRADLEEFVTIFEVTDDLRKDLDDFPDLRDAYERLVLSDSVSEKDFWMRYAYRCDPDRIAAEWDSDDDDDDDNNNNRSGAAGAPSLSKVTQFLGGAVKSVAASLKEADVQGSSAEGGIVGDVSTTTTTTAASFFGMGGGRPPFVMNTAVDEDDDDEDVPAEEEEELGWDDEDDDDEDDDDKAEDEDEPPQDSTQEEIEFRDAATEQLQEQLKQALEERDQLHETVAMQSKKIVDLTAQVEAGGGTDNAEGAEALKLRLFEAEAELAAVKERLLSSRSFGEPPTPKEESRSSPTPDGELHKVAEELQAKVSASEALCLTLRARVSELEEACQGLRSEKEACAARVASLEAVVETMEQDTSRAEADALEAAEKQDALVRELQAKLDVAERRISELEQGLADASRSASAASPETHESSASIVKVDAPASMEHSAAAAQQHEPPSPPTPMSLGAAHAAESPAAAAAPPPAVVQREEGGEEGSDWGDDW